MHNIELLRELCGCASVSGEEDAVRAVVLRELEGLADRVEVTALGNVIAMKKGKKPAAKKLMLDAQMDEVGLVVTEITEKGFLKFSAVGSVPEETLSAREVRINGNVPGVICAKPIHLLKGGERDKAVPIRELAIDIGASSKEEAEQAVSVGDNVTFAPYFSAENGTLQAKALDARLGCWMLLELMRRGPEYDAYYVFSVQKEIGTRGAGTAAYLLEPDAALILEGAPAADFGAGAPESCCALDKGPAVSFTDRWTLYDRAYYKRAFALGKELEIPVQPKTVGVPGGDGGSVQTARGGVRTAALGVPCRYVHGPVVLAREADVEHTLRLAEALAAQIAGGAV